MVFRVVAGTCLAAACLGAGCLAAADGASPPARAGDPLHSRDCMLAREALTQAQQDAAAKRAGASEKLAVAREQAKLACLGRDSGKARRVGAPDPPMAVAPPQIEAAPRELPQAQAPAVAPPPVAISRPAAIASCDPGGCWDSEGRRLNRVGPMLLGPHGGACTVAGGVVQCP